MVRWIRASREAATETAQTGSRLRVPSWGRSVKKAYLLASPKGDLRFTADNDGITLQLPGKAVDPIASVIVLEAGKQD